MYQAVPQRDDGPETVTRIVLLLDVSGAESVAAHAIRLTDDFGTSLSQLIPGVRAHVAVATPGRAPSGLVVDLRNRRVSIDGHPVRLAHREYALLAHLAARPHQTASRQTLIQQVWCDDTGPTDVSSRVVDTHIRRLRAKLGVHAHVLTTVRGRGYRFDPGTDVRIRSKNHVGDKSPQAHSSLLA